MKGLPKVLFVDDQDEVLEDIKVQVSDVCDPYGATTSEEGLEIFEKEGPFTVVVSDQILPGVDGADFLAQVIRRDPHVSTMLLTGHANYADAMTAVNDGHALSSFGKALFTGHSARCNHCRGTSEGFDGGRKGPVARNLGRGGQCFDRNFGHGEAKVFRAGQAGQEAG